MNEVLFVTCRLTAVETFQLRNAFHSIGAKVKIYPFVESLGACKIIVEDRLPDTIEDIIRQVLIDRGNVRILTNP
jgi:hypothetical protein